MLKVADIEHTVVLGIKAGPIIKMTQLYLLNYNSTFLRRTGELHPLCHHDQCIAVLRKESTHHFKRQIMNERKIIFVQIRR